MFHVNWSHLSCTFLCLLNEDPVHISGLCFYYLSGIYCSWIFDIHAIKNTRFQHWYRCDKCHALWRFRTLFPQTSGSPLMSPLSQVGISQGGMTHTLYLSLQVPWNMFIYLFHLSPRRTRRSMPRQYCGQVKWEHLLMSGGLGTTQRFVFPMDLYQNNQGGILTGKGGREGSENASK